MGQFTNVSYTGSYSGSGQGSDSDYGGPFTVTTSGTLTCVLSKDANGSISGTWSYSGSATIVSGYGTFVEPLKGSGTVSGSASNLVFTSSGAVFVNGMGALTNSDKTVTFGASFVFDGGSGYASGSMAGSPPVEVPIPTTFDVLAPTPVQWSGSFDSDGVGKFVSPQFTVDEVTGKWSLKSFPGIPDSVYKEVDMKYYAGEAISALIDTGKDALKEKADDYIKDSFGKYQGQELITLFNNAQKAKDYYDATTTLSKDTLQLLVDVPYVAAGLKSSDEIQARIDSIHAQFTKSLQDITGIDIQGYVDTTVAGIKWFLQRSDYVFGMQTGTGAYTGNEHRDTFIGGTSDDVFYGGTNDDIGFGAKGKDALSGEAGGDRLYGSGGTDTLNGGLGDDVLDGGADLDSAAFSGAKSGYTIAKTSTGYTISGPDGSDSLTGVEKLQFSGGTVYVMSEMSKLLPSAQLKSLNELYVAFFNRVPEAAGLAYWIEQAANGMSFNSMAQVFYEAAVQYSSVTGYSASMSDADFVKIIYANVLGRSGSTAPSSDEVNYWVGELNNGHATKGSLVSSMLTAAHGLASDPTWGWVSSLLDNKSTVAQYHAVTLAIDYAVADQAITQTKAIAAAVTSTDTTAAISLIGITAPSMVLTDATLTVA